MANWEAVSRREEEILDAVRQRLTNAEIGARFFISERTVESHVSSLLRKLGVRDRSALAALTPPAAPKDRAELPGQVEILMGEPLVGRGDELDQLRALWIKAKAGLTMLGVVTGEAGVGKSRLVAELAAQADRDGAPVLWGTCFEDVQAPYQPLVDALEDHASLLTTSSLAEELGGAATALLGGIVGGRDTVAPAHLAMPSDASTGASQLAAALRRFFGWLGAKGPVLLVVEDMHWAAESTRDALLQLVRSASASPLLVVATARDTQPDLGPAGEVFLGQCELLPNSARLSLDGLDPTAVGDLLASLGSAVDSREVCAETGGNPLLVREVARSDARGSSLAALLAPRYRRLGTDAREVLDAAATLGSAFDATLISGMLDRPVMRVVQALDEAEAAGLVVPIPDRPGRFAFVHPLFRTLHYDALPTSTRLRLHHHAAIELERSAVDDRAVAALARHACIAAPIGDARAAVRHARQAAKVAERVLALDEAAHHYRQALQVTELLPDERRLRLELTVSLGRVLVESGDPAGRRTLSEAVPWARELADGAALADIAWAMAPFGRPPTPGAPDPEFVSIAEDALAALPDATSTARAKVLAALSVQMSAGGDPERGYRCATDSLRMARELDDPATLGVALLANRVAGGLPLRPEPRLQLAEEMVGLGDRLRAPSFTINGLYTKAWASRELGDLDDHDASVAALERVLDEHPTPTFRMFAVLYRAVQQLLRGDLHGSETMVAEAMALAPLTGSDPLDTCGPVQMAILHARGEVGALAPLIEAQVQNLPGFGGAYAGLLGVAYAFAGRLDDAQAVVSAAVADGFTAVQPNMSYTTGLALFAEAAEMTGDRRAGRMLLDLLEPFSGLLVDNSSSVFETVDLAITKAALAAGDVTRASESAERVLASSVARRSPLVRARAQVRLAAACAGGATSAQAPAALIADALEVARETGALVIEHDADRFGLLTR